MVAKLTKESEEKTYESRIRIIYFNYSFGRIDSIGRFPFRLIAERRRDEDFYELRVVSQPEDLGAFQSLVTFIRMTVVDWSVSREVK